MTAVAVWSIVLKPGQKETLVPQADLHIKNAALGEALSETSGRTTVKLTYPNPAKFDDDEEEDDEDDEDSPVAEMTTVLCSLSAGKIEQSACDIILEGDEEYSFELVGKNTVYLYGNYIDQNANQPPYDSDMESDVSDQEGYDLQDVSSDVEIPAGELQGLEEDTERFEELSDDAGDEQKAQDLKALKRPRDEAMETDEQPAEKISKSVKKRAKKQKGEDGKAISLAVEEAAEPKLEKEQEKKSEKKSDKKEKKKQKTADEKKGGAFKELTGGVKIRDEKPGDGKAAKNGAKVSMRYIGKLQNGKVFDQNTSGKPFNFKLGAGSVIKGWDIGVLGMQIGGEREIIVPPAMGYGSQKIPGIPPNSTLIFEVKCLEIK